MSCPCSISVCYFKSSPTCGAELLILKHRIRENLQTLRTRRKVSNLFSVNTAVSTVSEG